MKIIKEGVPPGSKVVEMHCNQCGCVFEATREEFIFQADQRDGDFWKIICPTNGCNHTLFKYSWR